MSQENEAHISHEAMEALAAGETAESRDHAHLQECAECRATLAAVREENTLFAAELRAAPENEGVSVTPSIAMARLPAAQRHKPFVIYAAAASVMLIAALGLIALRQTPETSVALPNVSTPPARSTPPTLPIPNEQTMAANAQKTKPKQEDLKEDQQPPPVPDPVVPSQVPVVVNETRTDSQPNVNARQAVNSKDMHENAAINPAPVAPPNEIHASRPPPPGPAQGPVAPPAAEEIAYEGKTTLEWLGILQQDMNTKELHDKAVHALTQIGRDGLPQILSFLGENGTNDRIGAVLNQIEVQREDLPHFTKLLKDPSFAVRKAGVLLLANLAQHQSELQKDVLDALNPALQDRDKAVVEAARDAINRLYPDSVIRNIETLLGSGKTDAARKVLEDARPKLSVAYYDQIAAIISMREYATLSDEVKAKMDKGDLDGALAQATAVLKKFPNDPTVNSLVHQISDKKEAEKKKLSIEMLKMQLKAAQDKLDAMQKASSDLQLTARQEAEVQKLHEQLMKLAPDTKPRRPASVGESTIDD